MKELNYSLRADEIADLDPYNIRSKPTLTPESELIVREPSLHFERFTDEEKEKLNILEFNIFTLHGETLQSLSSKGARIEWDWDAQPDVFHESYRSEVAIGLKYLHQSRMKTYLEQVKELIYYEQVLKESMQDVNVVIGKAEDYAEIFYQDPEFFNATSEGLMVRTCTETDEAKNMRAQFSMSGDVLKFQSAAEFIRLPSIVIAPLIIPQLF